MTDLPTTTLEHLLTGISNKNSSAFEQLYRHYHDFVFAFVLHMHADRDDAEEITDDVFMVLALKPETFQGAARFSTWLLGIAKNKVFDRMRQRGRTIRTESIDEADWCELADESGDVVTQAISQEKIHAIENCRDQLPIEQKEAWFMVNVMGASMSEIAAKQDCPVGTVKSRLFNAGQKIKRCMGAWLNGATA
jgi:RNA polymerase sigma-70 factor (ECF subfamily)